MSDVDDMRHLHDIARSMRNPEQFPHVKGWSAEQVGVYRELVFNNIESLLSNCFPLFKASIGEKTWSNVIEQFIAYHKSKTPYYFQLATELQDFLNHEASISLPRCAQSLVDLECQLILCAHFQNTKLFRSSDVTTEVLINNEIYLNETAWSLRYDYPIDALFNTFPINGLPPHQKNEFIETVNSMSLKPCFIVVYRNQHHEVRQLKLNALSYYFFTLLSDYSGSAEAVTPRHIICQLAQTLNLSLEKVMTSGAELLQQWQRECIVSVCKPGKRRCLLHGMD